jgi:hypothetical protein
VNVRELAAQDPALLVGFVEGHEGAAHFILAGIAELTGRVKRETYQDRLLGFLRPDVVVLPWAEEGETGGGRRALVFMTFPPLGEPAAQLASSGYHTTGLSSLRFQQAG